MNLFENIFNKAKGGVNYLATGQAGSDLYDWANPETKDPIQRFFDDPAQDMSKKQALMDNLKAGVPKEVMKSYVTEKYYKPVEFKQTVPTLDPTFKYTGDEGVATGIAKQIGNIPSSLYNFGATGVNLASTAYQEGIPETTGMLARGAVKSAGQGAESVATSYRNQGLLGATNTVLEGANKFLMEDPISVVGTPGVGSLATRGTKAGAKAIVRGADAVAPKATQLVKNVSAKLPKAEELLVNQLEKTNRMNPTKYMEFEQMSGQRAGKFLADRKITGDAESSVSKLYDNFAKSKGEADKGLSAIEKTYKTSEVPQAYQEMLGELEKRFTYTKDNSNLAKIKDYKNKLENGTLSHNDINGAKRLYEQKVKVNYIKDQNSLEVERATNIDNDVRNWQFDEADKLGFSNLRDINKETQLNRYLADNIGDKIARQAGLNNISLTDWIIAGQVPATPQALALLAGKKFAQNVVPKLYQKGLEKIAKMPLKKTPVADIGNISKMETIRKSVNPQYDTNRLLVSPRNSSRTPTTITPEVTLPTGEKGILTKKTPNIKSDITSKSKIVRPGTKPLTSQTQANGPRVIGKMGKVETKTTPQSATSYEQGMRRPFTMGANKPLVKNAQEKLSNPLVEEARKYKSADEFVKAQANTYHGTSQTFDKFSKEGLGRSTSTIAGKKGFWFTDSPDEALSYAKMSGKSMLKDEIKIEKEINKLLDQITIAEKKGNWDLADELTGKISELEQSSRAGGLEIVMPIKIDKSKLFKYDASGKSMNQGRIDEVITKAKKEGYEGVTFKNISDNPDDASIITTQHIVFDPKNIKTDSELKRIYEQSKKLTK